MPALFFASVAGYAVAVIVHVVVLFQRGDRTAHVARWALLAALVLHTGAMGSYCLQGLHPLRDISGVLDLTAWLLVVGYLLAGLRWRLATAGALIVPMALAMLIAGHLTPRGGPAAGVASTFGRLHLILVAMGIAAFALSSAVSLLYLLQEAAIKRHRLGGFYRRTPPLTVLDDIARRLTLIGFPAFTLAIIAGVVWVAWLPRPGGFRVEYLLSAVVLLDFGLLIVARAVTGMRGRRAAILTLVGFATSCLVILVYVARRVVGG